MTILKMRPYSFKENDTADRSRPRILWIDPIKEVIDYEKQRQLDPRSPAKRLHDFVIKNPEMMKGIVERQRKILSGEKFI